MKRFWIFSFLLVCAFFCSNTPFVSATPFFFVSATPPPSARYDMHSWQYHEIAEGLVVRISIVYEHRSCEPSGNIVKWIGLRTWTVPSGSSWEVDKVRSGVSLNSQRNAGTVNVFGTLRSSDGTVRQVEYSSPIFADVHCTVG